ncbi:silent information regulator protein Sir2 [Paenibacillus baekrokdamisoli]|uniref:Silent information regulator protein Sir2 n=1 Tax=Paenibacillus baekrokdamisoli TaxID=1712516 RepID=A0A3G9JNR1_9BACL|nr:6-phospho-3-hexuloisomerase [Paenibacillus baekrokdamisoli]MBB3071475.1 6-phospho-3-hexuloisomerase [Paenibacillus baekrokdamisoli]BBH24494.1 silent information regulator protein Sir2 [Paenibacillus baekrokdamisoli]
MDLKRLSGIILTELAEVFDRVDSDQWGQVVERVRRSPRIFLIGVGREGLATRGLAMRLMHLGKETHWVWDDTTPAIREGDLLIATSGSGEIGHIHYVAEQAKKAGAELVVITGTPDRMTSHIADAVLWVPAAVYRGKGDLVPSIQPMGNLFEQSIALLFDILVMMLQNGLSVTRQEMEARHRNFE